MIALKERMTPRKAPVRPANAVPDAVAWGRLGLSRATFFRKLRTGALSAPVARSGTRRRWWTPSDLDCAREELAWRPAAGGSG